MSLREIFTVLRWSRYHYNLIKTCYWKHNLTLYDCDTLVRTMKNFNFKNIILGSVDPNEFQNNVNFQLPHEDINEKILRTKIQIFYETKYSSLLKFLVKNAKEIQIKILSEMPWWKHGPFIKWKQNVLTVKCQNIKQALMTMCTNTMVTALSQQHKTYVNELLDQCVRIDMPPDLLQKLIVRSSKSKFADILPLSHRSFYYPKIIEQFYIFNPKKIKDIEQDQNIIHNLSTNFFDWHSIISDNKIFWRVNNLDTSNISNIRFVWCNQYETNYLDEICAHYGYDLGESKQYLSELTQNNFELFFSWLETTPLKNTCICVFLIQNMYQAVRCYYPDKLNDYVLHCVETYGCLPNGVQYYNAYILLLITLMDDGQVDTVLCALKMILSNDTDMHTKITPIFYIWGSIVFHNRLNAFHLLQEILSNNMINDDTKLLFQIVLPIVIIFKSFDRISLEMLSMITTNAIGQQSNVWVNKLREELTSENHIETITIHFLDRMKFEHLDLWVKLWKCYYGETWNENKHFVHSGKISNYFSKKEELQWLEKNGFQVKIDESLESQCEIVAHHYEDIQIWSKHLTIKPNVINADLLLRMLKYIYGTKRTIGLLNFWHDCERTVDQTYHSIIDWASSHKSLEILEWWKNKGLPFYYTRGAFDGACQMAYIKIVTWWILNFGEEKKSTTKTDMIQFGGFYRGDKWHSPQSRIILYSDNGIKHMNTKICEIWKYHGFHIKSKKWIENEITKLPKEVAEKKLRLLEWLTKQ